MANCVEIPCRALLFDCDGVLVDSRADGERAWRQWAREYGLDEQAVLGSIHGRPSRDTVRAHLRPPHDTGALERIDAIELADAVHTRAIPGAAELIRTALPHSAIVTSASPALLAARLTAAGVPRPDVVVTGSDVTRGKPDPEPFLLAAARLGIPISQCVVVEDSAAGIAAGRAARAAAVLGVGAEAARYGADMVVDDLRGIGWTDGTVRLAGCVEHSKLLSDKGNQPSC